MALLPADLREKLRTALDSNKSDRKLRLNQSVANLEAVFDQDGDGQFSAADVMAMRTAFAVFDQDGDGTFSVDDVLGIIIAGAGDTPKTREDAATLIELLDHDGDGKLTVEELAAAWLPSEVSSMFANKSIPFLLCRGTTDGSLQLLRRAPDRKSDIPIYLIAGGLGPPPGPFPPQPGQLFLLLRYPLQSEVTAAETAPWMLQFLQTHVPAGSQVLFNSFSAGVVWYLLVHERAALAALRIEIVLVCLYHTGMEGTDVGEVLSYIEQTDFIRIIFTHHDLGRYFGGIPEKEPLIAGLLKHAHRASSAEFLAMGPAEAKGHKMLYVGTEEEAKDILKLVAAGTSLDPTLFALHGSTQKKAAQLLYDDEAYKMRAYGNSTGELPGAIPGFWARGAEPPEE